MGQRKAEGAVLDMEFPVEVWLASERVPLGRLLSLAPGDEVPLTGNAEETVELVANGNTLASGELVVVDGKFGVRIKETTSTRLARLPGEAEGSEKPESEEAES